MRGISPFETPLGDRALDEVVFEAVYGFTRLGDNQLPAGEEGQEVWVNLFATALSGALHQGPPPAFSTEIAAAWPIMEAMADEGYWPMIGREGQGWTARAMRQNDPIAVQAKTAPEAICRLALRMKETLE